MTDWRYYLVLLGGAVGGTLLLLAFVSGDPLVRLVALIVFVPTLFGIVWLWRREP